MPTSQDQAEASPLEPEVFMPLAGYKISSAFGWRKHPLTGKQHFHNGVDLPARSQVVHVIMSGRVESTGYHKNLGKFIRIDHGFICSIYGHLSRIAVKNGQVLPAGFPIATTGSTGRSTGEHLHLSIRSKDTYIDPWKFLQGLLTNSTTNIN
ncbi:M23 family metallopeptidase [Sphingobacterium siyangense]|uniref:M23 family metallopeptidase n=1 Tax=Sphingobacterium siyangense TaxID=459529 RepID=UPI0031F8316B